MLSIAVPSLSRSRGHSSQTMGPSGSDKRRTAAGLGLVTSVLLSPHNPEQTTGMGLGSLFTRTSGSSSSNSPSRPQGGYSLPPSPGGSKGDYPHGPSSPDSSDPKWPAQSHNPHYDDAPPAYSPKQNSNLSDWATDFKKPAPSKKSASSKFYTTPVYFPPLVGGEDPLLPLKYYDIVMILDDSYSMTKTDNPDKISRWDQVSDGSLPTANAPPS